MEKIFSSFHLSWDSFLVGISQITMECRMQDIPILGSLEITQVTWMISVGSIHLKESVPIKWSVHLEESVPIKEFVHFIGFVRLSTFRSRRDSVYQVFDCQAI